jgi:hypothetical protein
MTAMTASPNTSITTFNNGQKSIITEDVKSPERAVVFLILDFLKFRALHLSCLLTNCCRVVIAGMGYLFFRVLVLFGGRGLDKR